MYLDKLKINNLVILVVARFAKIFIYSFVCLLISIGFGVELYHLDTESESEAESADKKTDKGKAIADPSQKSSGDSDSGQTSADSDKVKSDKVGGYDTETFSSAYKVNIKEFEKTSGPRSTFGSSDSINSRIHGILHRFIALDLEEKNSEIKKQGLDDKEYSELTPDQKLLVDRAKSDSNALSKAGSDQAISDFKAETAKAAFYKAEAGSSQVPKRELEEAPVETFSKKVSLGRDSNPDSSSKKDSSAEDSDDSMA